MIARVIGCGAVSAAGLGPAPLLDALVSCRPGSARPRGRRAGRHVLLRADARFPGAPVGAADVQVDRRWPRCVSFAAEAARQALDGAPPPGRGALVLATTHGGSGFCQEFHEGFSSPLLFSASVHNAAASFLSERWRVQGPVHTLLAGSDGTAQALETAAALLAQGLADWAIAGATEELNAAILAGYASLGFRGSPAEGAAIFVLARDGRPLERLPAGRLRLDGVEVDPSSIGEAFAVTQGFLLAASWAADAASTGVASELLPVWGDRPV